MYKFSFTTSSINIDNSLYQHKASEIRKASAAYARCNWLGPAAQSYCPTLDTERPSACSYIPEGPMCKNIPKSALAESVNNNNTNESSNDKEITS